MTKNRRELIESLKLALRVLESQKDMAYGFLSTDSSELEKARELVILQLVSKITNISKTIYFFDNPDNRKRITKRKNNGR